MVPELNYQRLDAQPGATSQDLLDFTNRFLFRLPPEHLEILQESNGVTYWLPTHEKEIQFLSTVEIDDHFSAYKFEQFMPGAIPFAMDGSSNFLVYDGRSTSGSSPVFLAAANNLGWDETSEIAADFRSFLADPRPPEKVR